MAGVVPTRKSASGRKQWTIHDGLRGGSLKRLRSQLANEGCPESQVVLAKQLLEEPCDVNCENIENAKLGVYWLMKASEQGNTEATELLKKCWHSGKGITEQNFLDVKTCISMTQEEKLARKAAREMFASLSNGEDFITTNQLQKKMLSIEKSGENSKSNYEAHINNHSSFPNHSEIMNNYDEISDSSEDETDWTLRAKDNVEKLTEDHLVTAAVSYSHGHLPLVNRALFLTDPNLAILDDIPFIYRSILHPILALKILYYRIIKFLGQQSFFKDFPIAKADLQILILLFVYCFASAENSIYVIPIILYYISFIVLTLATFQMLQSKRDLLDFRVWSRLFITYSGGSLKPEQAEFQFVRNNLKPFGHYFLALLANLIIYPVILQLWLPQSEITVFAFCLTFMTLFGFMSKRNGKLVYDYLILLSFAINVLAKYPYETDTVVMQGWRFLDLKTPTFASYVIGNGIEFCINFRVVLYAFIPVLFVKIAARDNWRGTYKFLIPHCVTLSWLQIVIINSQGATMYGLLRSTLALVGFVMFLPLAGLTAVLIPAAALTKWLISANTLYMLSIFLVLTSLGLGVSWLLAKSRYSNFTSICQVCIAAVALYFLLVSKTSEKSIYDVEADGLPKSVPWDQYEQFCFDMSNIQKTTANVQLNCWELADLHVQWEGYVKDVKIVGVHNRWKTLFDYFPKSLQEYLYCLYGDPVESNCKNRKHSALSEEFCLSYREVMKSGRRCTLEKYNIYDILISVKMQYHLWDKGVELYLEASDMFRNFTLNLKPDDHIWFKGSLKKNDQDFGANLHNKNPLSLIELNEIGCISCINTDLTNVKEDSDKAGLDLRKLFGDIYLGLKCVLNFLLYPLVVFK